MIDHLSMPLCLIMPANLSRVIVSRVRYSIVRTHDVMRYTVNTYLCLYGGRRMNECFLCFDDQKLTGTISNRRTDWCLSLPVTTRRVVERCVWYQWSSSRDYIST